MTGVTTPGVDSLTLFHNRSEAGLHEHGMNGRCRDEWRRDAQRRFWNFCSKAVGINFNAEFDIFTRRSYDGRSDAWRRFSQLRFQTDHMNPCMKLASVEGDGTIGVGFENSVQKPFLF